MSDFQLVLISVVLTLLLVFVCQRYVVRLSGFGHIKKYFVDEAVSTHTKHNVEISDLSKVKSYEQLVEVLDEYEKHQETKEQQQLIAELKRQMKEMLGQVDSYEDRIMVVTYCIENIFNVLNNKKTISFNEFYKILSNQIVSSKSFDPAFKNYVKNRKSGGRFF